MERMEDLGDERDGIGMLPTPEGTLVSVHEQVFPLGQRLLEHLGTPVTLSASGLPSTILPAGDFGLLVLGIPIPVFSYMGDDNQALQRRAVDLLNATTGGTLDGNRHVALHSFSKCFDRASEEEMLALLPGFRALNGSRKASFLGVQMVTVLPLSTEESSLWPHGPAPVCQCVDRFRDVISQIYGQLDRDLIQMHRSKPLPGRHRAVWIAEPPG